MEEAAYYIGSITQFRGCRIVQRRGCDCPQCRHRTAQEARQEPRLMLTVEPGNGAPTELLIHARRSSIQVHYIEF